MHAEEHGESKGRCGAHRKIIEANPRCYRRQGNFIGRLTVDAITCTLGGSPCGPSIPLVQAGKAIITSPHCVAVAELIPERSKFFHRLEASLLTVESR